MFPFKKLFHRRAKSCAVYIDRLVVGMGVSLWYHRKVFGKHSQGCRGSRRRLGVFDALLRKGCQKGDSGLPDCVTWSNPLRTFSWFLQTALGEDSLGCLLWRFFPGRVVRFDHGFQFSREASTSLSLVSPGISFTKQHNKPVRQVELVSTSLYHGSVLPLPPGPKERLQLEPFL